MATQIRATKSVSSSTRSAAAKVAPAAVSTMKTPRGPAVALMHVAIKARAEQIWRIQGCPVGRDLQNWLEAEAQLTAH